jgi:G3E family GTPase
VQGDLVKALKQLHQRSSKREIPPLARVVIETTGLADPVPVIYTLMEERFIAARYVCDGVLTAVDATHGLAQLDAHREAVRQVAMADRLLVTKGDQADPPPAPGSTHGWTASTPALRASTCATAGSSRINCSAAASTRPPANCRTWPHGSARSAAATSKPAPPPQPGPGSGANPAPRPHAARHDGSVSSFVVRFDAPVPWFGFAAAMGRYCRTTGPVCCA